MSGRNDAGQFINGHMALNANRLLTAEQINAKFWSNVAIIPFHECWEWIGRSSGKDGYGRFFVGLGKSVRAHQYSFTMQNRAQSGLVIDHICRNRSCVNPRHLRAVTRRTNALENNTGPTAANNQKTHCIRGHLFDLRNTHTRFRSGNKTRVCRACDNARTKNKAAAKAKAVS